MMLGKSYSRPRKWGGRMASATQGGQSGDLGQQLLGIGSPLGKAVLRESPISLLGAGYPLPQRSPLAGLDSMAVLSPFSSPAQFFHVPRINSRTYR